MIKVKFNSNIGIDYFYDIFKKRKIKFPKGYFFARNYSPSHIYLRKPLFVSLISTYLDVYFRDFYSHNDVQYFPLSGKLMKVKGKGFYKNVNSSHTTDAINWIWFLRPALNYVTNLKIHKLTGSGSRLDRLEKEYKQYFDAGLLPNVNDALKDLNTNNKLYA